MGTFSLYLNPDKMIKAFLIFAVLASCSSKKLYYIGTLKNCVSQDFKVTVMDIIEATGNSDLDTRCKTTSNSYDNIRAKCEGLRPNKHSVKCFGRKGCNIRFFCKKRL